MEIRTIQALELDKVIDILKEHATSPLGRHLAASLAPATDEFEVTTSLQKTQEMLDILEKGELFNFAEIQDMGPILQKTGCEGIPLSAEELLHCRRAMELGWELRECLIAKHSRTQILAKMGGGIPDFSEVSAAVSQKIDPSGEVRDRASSELSQIRSEIRRKRARLYSIFEEILKSNRLAVQDEVITFRNGRLVLPVRSEYKSQLPGIVHGKSSSGVTVFIEPYSTVEENNHLTLLKEREEEEIQRILLELTTLIRERHQELETLVEVLGELDLLVAKASFARRLEAARPVLSRRGVFSLVRCRHPLLEIRNARGSAVDSVVPISIALDNENSTMVITGPNAGGKTVALKTAGLLALMNQCGMLIPAGPESELPIFASVFAEIGDNQNLAQNLSTFSAHLKNIQSMVEQYEEPALILIDEVGAGTAPTEGAALGIAITDYFHQKGAKTIVTTHHEPIKQYAMQTRGIVNASVDFDEKTCRPTYRLITGIPGKSNALKIAENMGFPEEIIQRAKDFLHSTSDAKDRIAARLESLLRENEERKEKLAEEVKRLKDREERISEKEVSLETQGKQALAEEARSRRQETQKILKQLSEECNRILEEAGKELYLADVHTRVRKRIRKLEQSVAEKLPPEKAEGEARGVLDWKRGDRANWKTFNLEAVVEEPGSRHQKIGVTVGGKKIYLSPQELEPLKGPGAPAPLSVQVNVQVDEDSTSELNLIGYTVEEALPIADKFIDRALVAGRRAVRLVHGHGSGRLKKAIREWLAEHPGVAGFQDAPSYQGGSGATVVKLED